MTCRSNRIIGVPGTPGSRQIMLQTGTNRLQIPVTADMAPGFTLEVSVMADDVGWDKRAPAMPGPP